MMRRRLASCAPLVRAIGVGLAVALLVAPIAACETLSLDGPAAAGPADATRPDEPVIDADAARPDEPVIDAEAEAIAAQRPAEAPEKFAPVGVETAAPTTSEIYPGTGVLAGRPAFRAAEVAIESDGRVTLNFANAEIREVVDVVLGETLGVSYIIDPKVQGQVTARTSRPIPRTAVIPALENILALNGAALTLVDGIYKVVTLQQAATSLTTPVVVPTRQDLSRGFAIHVIPLQFASASAVADILKPFVAQGRVLRVDTARNLLIFAGTGTETRDLIDMVTVFDIDWMAGMSFALFPIQVADAKSLVSDLETVFLEGDSPLAGVLRFVPIERLNAVLAISTQPAYLDEAEIWVERLDRGAAGAGRRIFVYHVQNGRAADLADVLSSIFETGITDSRAGAAPELAPGLSPVSIAPPGPAPQPGQPPAVQGQESPAQPAAPSPAGDAAARPAGAQQAAATPAGVEAAARPAGALPAAARRNDRGAIQAVEDSGDIRIIADEKNNALVILATAAEYRMIEATLERLDITPLQVLIEVTIAEVTLTDDLQYGLQWFFDKGDSSFTFSSLSTGAISSAFPGFSYLFSSSNVRVVLDALTQITDVRVISSPQLMVLDNQSARLQVGDQVPIATQSAVSITDASAPVVNSIQFRDTGVILEVTPRVNASGLVVLDVLQEVSTVEQTTTSDIDSPTIRQRSITSTVAVQSGDSIALGGLIQDQNEENVTGIPVLSSIPIFGNLFKTTANLTDRTELLVLITPRVVRDRREALDVTEELRRRLSTLEPLEKKIKLLE